MEQELLPDKDRGEEAQRDPAKLGEQAPAQQISGVHMFRVQVQGLQVV